MWMLDELAFSAVKRHKMISQGDMVTVGLSGGADSVALLSFLHKHKGSLDISLKAAHLNHNLRGEESCHDENFVRQLCRELGITLEIKSVDVAALAKQRGVSLEVCGREERYAFFEEIAEGGKIATAHNATDNIETVLLNMARGSALKGLCGIPPVRGRLIRPLIFCPREIIESYCQDENLAFVTDSSNNSDVYSRNRVRHQAMPVLRGIQPELERRITEMTELLRLDEDYLSAEAARVIEKIKCGNNSYLRSGYISLHPAVAARVIILLLKEHSLPYDNARVTAIDKAIREGSGIIQLPTAAKISVNRRGAGQRLGIDSEKFYFM